MPCICTSARSCKPSGDVTVFSAAFGGLVAVAAGRCWAAAVATVEDDSGAAAAAVAAVGIGMRGLVSVGLEARVAAALVDEPTLLLAGVTGAARVAADCWKCAQEVSGGAGAAALIWLAVKRLLSEAAAAARPAVEGAADVN